MNIARIACLSLIPLALASMTACGDASAPASTGASAAAAAPAEPPVEVKGSTLAKDYEENTVAADQKYKGKRLLITGVITDISTDFTGDPYVVVRGTNDSMGPQLQFKKADLDQLASLKKGATIKALCTGNGDIAKSPMNKNCALQQ